MLEDVLCVRWDRAGIEHVGDRESLASPARGSVAEGSVTACTRIVKVASLKVRNHCSEYQTRLVPSASWVTSARPLMTAALE